MSSYGKCMDFPINLPHYEKMQQNPWYGKNLGNWYSYFSHGMSAFFSHQNPILWYNSSHGKCIISITLGKTAEPIEWGNSGKLVSSNILQNPSNVENVGNCYSYFSHSIGVLFYQIPILWYASSHVKWMGFIIKLPIALKNPLNGEGLGTWFPYFFDKMGEFFHQITILQYTLSYGKCMSFLINFPQHRKRQEKPLNGKSLGN